MELFVAIYFTVAAITALGVGIYNAWSWDAILGVASFFLTAVVFAALFLLGLGVIHFWTEALT